MLHTPPLDTPSSRVIVRFGDGAHSFPIRDGATLNDLADYVGHLGALHDGAPISIEFEFAEPRSITSRQQDHAITH